MPVCIILVSDSRGRGLKDFFLNSEDEWESEIRVIERCIPGADLHQLSSEVRRLVRQAEDRYPTYRTIAVLTGGICSFTSKFRKRGQEELYYLHTETRVDSIKQTFSDIWDYATSRGVYMLTSTIIPASLKKAAQSSKDKGRLIRSCFSDTDLESQQAKLEEDVDLVNKFIVESSHHRLYYINLHKEICKTSIKKLGFTEADKYKKRIVKYKYLHLHDGVHADEHLQGCIFRKILNACKNLAPAEKRKDREVSEEPSGDKWDFKRRHSD